MTEALSMFEPHRTMYLRGFDRRGCAASLHDASAAGFTVTGNFADQADFAVLVLHDADDNYGHLQTTRYLPKFDLTGVVVDVDVALSGCFSPTSVKFDSLQAAQLSYITETGTPGTAGLAQCMTSITGGAPASLAVTIGGTIATGDVFQVVYEGNFRFSYTAPSGATPSSVASGLTVAINTGAGSGLSITPFAVWNGSTGITIYAGRQAVAAQMTLSGAAMSITSAAKVAGVGFWGLQVGDTVMFTDGATMEKHTVATFTDPWHITLDSSVALTATIAMWPLYQADGNSVQLWAATTSVAGTISPAGYPKLTGGASETKLHLKIDFSALSITSLRQCWLTFAPILNLDSTANDQTIQPFAQSAFAAAFTNLSVADPNGKTPLKIAGPGSVLVSSRDWWAGFTPNWTTEEGFYYHGFSRATATPGASVTVTYSCQHTHDLYLGTVLESGNGTFHVSLDGSSLADLNTSDPSISEPLTARRILSAGVPAGTHVLKLTAATSGANHWFDYLQAVVQSDVQDPAYVYPAINAACDFDTGQTYQIAPARSIFISQRMGFAGDVDFYAGVFFALKRVRYGGSFHAATVTLGGSLVPGDGVFLAVSGQSIGVGITAMDTLTTVAQRFCNSINSQFVGVWAAPTGTAGKFTVTVLSPINGFSFSVTSGSSITISFTGDIGVSVNGVMTGGQEGVWQPDPSQTSPINPAFGAYLADFATILQGAGQTMTLAFSQELLAPPDANTAGGSWIQRFADGTPVLTSTGFGSWGAGFVEGAAAGPPVVITQTGHGYLTGNIAHFANATGGGGVWEITVTGANTYQLTAQVSNTGGYTPGVDDQVFIELQTSQCNFNPSTVTPYLSNCYKQAAGILSTAGFTTPWLQFGEVGWWFFSEHMSETIGSASWTAPINIGTPKAHNLATGQRVIIAGVRGNIAANGDWTITVVSSTHFTLNGSSGSGTYVPGTGTVSGGGMAYYDAYTASLGTLGTYYTQDDAVSSADASFLQGQITSHLSAIRSAVQAAYSGTKFEALFPYDVNFPTCYYTPDLPFPQGGRANRRVNVPAGFLGPGGVIDRIKVEGLSWETEYFNLDNSKETQLFPTEIGAWAPSSVFALVGISSGAATWMQSFLSAINSASLAQLNLWAVDHIVLLSWDTQPLPLNYPRVM